MIPEDKRKELVERKNREICIANQCKLLSISRSSFYYKPRGECELNLELMSLMDKEYHNHPYYGAARMHSWLTNDMGYEVNIKRVSRLYYDIMSLRSILPGPHTSKRHKDHKVYPYLLRDIEVNKPNQVWATDITYIPMNKGFMYLMAIMDIHSRYIVGWSLSNTMDADWCAGTLDATIQAKGRPEIVNTDQGSQFTSAAFTGLFEEMKDMKLSMDGKGRATDNAWIERFWRSIKYEKIYPNPANDGLELYEQIDNYVKWYNEERRHESIENKRPNDLYRNKIKIKAA